MVKRASIEMKLRGLFLLISYAAVLFPAAASQVICINDGGSVSIEPEVHLCHGADHGHTHNHSHDHTHVDHTDKNTDHSHQHDVLGQQHPESCCIDVPLGNSTPQLTFKVGNPPIPVGCSFTAVNSASMPSPPERFVSSDHPPPDINRLTTIVLLI